MKRFLTRENKRSNNVEQVATTSNAGTTTTDQELGSKMSREQIQNHPLYRIDFESHV
jgi:hypothetical protein